MKRMKGVLSVGSRPYLLDEDSKNGMKFQSLLQDYEELFEETMAKKKKLQLMKHKKSTLLAEVRFLRRRYEYLTENRSLNHGQKEEHIEAQKYDIQTTTNIKKVKNYAKKKLGLPPLAPVSSAKKKVGLPRLAPVSAAKKKVALRGINQTEPIYSRIEDSLQSAPISHLDQKEGKCSEHEADKRHMNPVFDLNQISSEEEELQADCAPLRIQEPNESSLLRSDEPHNDMQISVCRSTGNGSSQAGKRKVSWQDQVAVKV